MFYDRLSALCLIPSFIRSVGTPLHPIMISTLSRYNSASTGLNQDSNPQSHGLYVSPATLKLNRIFEQNRQRQQKKDGGKVQEPPATPQAKGKPRLLLMGQRRYGLIILFSDLLGRRLTRPFQEWQVVHIKRCFSQTATKRDVVSRIDS